MLPIIGSVLLSLGAKLGLDLITKAWKAHSEKPAAGGATPAAAPAGATGFGAVLKDRTAAVPMLTDLPPATGAASATGRRVGVDDTASAAMLAANWNGGAPVDPGQLPASSAILAYLQNTPQAG